jgi:beta-mannosidase
VTRGAYGAGVLRLTTARVTDADPGQDLSGVADDSSWLAVDVPGDLHLALAAAGRIPVPDFGLSNDDCRWVEDRSSWYRLRLPALAEPHRLVCHGLDTVATLYLDGDRLGTSRNMFRPAVFDLAPADRERVLSICFDPPGEDAAVARKAAYSWGWDFAPRRPAVGVWRPVELVSAARPRITGVRFRTLSLADGVARVETIVDHDGEAEVVTRLVAPDGSVTAGTAELPAPHLWWTHDRGAPALYDLEVDLVVDGQVVDGDRRRVGVRTVELDRTDGAFAFVLNGVPLAVRGANWVPPHTALGAVDPRRYLHLLTAARDAHMTMLRVWGGGTYEHDLFYETCDRLGILVFQDFMFACKDYRDDDPAFVAEVEAEAVHQVRRLQPHPCLALWCGNNEVELLAGLLDWESPSPAHGLFHELLPAVVAREDGRTPYVHGSPVAYNSRTDGDRHAWEVWHGLDVDDDRTGAAWSLDRGLVDPASPEAAEFVAGAGPHRYLLDQGRFASEYGLGALPSYETLQRWTDPDQLYLGSAQVTARTKLGRLGPANKLDLIVAAYAGEPKDLRDLVELSQLTQAEGNKVGMEHYRRQWPRCSGSLVWQLDDCWPSTSWALIDVEGRAKAAYWAARRAFAPVLASFAPTADGVELWLTNDADEPYDDELVVRCATFDGASAWEAGVATRVPARSSRPLASWAAEGPDRYLSVRGTGVRNRHFFAPYKDLVRTVEAPTYDVAGDAVTVTATTYAIAVHLVSADPHRWYSDDFFDLEPGESRTVSGPPPVALRSR